MLRFGAPRLYLCSTNLQYSGKKCGVYCFILYFYCIFAFADELKNLTVDIMT